MLAICLCSLPFIFSAGTKMDRMQNYSIATLLDTKGLETDIFLEDVLLISIASCGFSSLAVSLVTSTWSPSKENHI